MEYGVENGQQTFYIDPVNGDNRDLSMLRFIGRSASAISLQNRWGKWCKLLFSEGHICKRRSSVPGDAMRVDSGSSIITMAFYGKAHGVLCEVHGELKIGQGPFGGRSSGGVLQGAPKS